MPIPEVSSNAQGFRRRGRLCLVHLYTAGPGSLASGLFPGWPQGGAGEPGLASPPPGRLPRWEEH
jgi:hypothetical protein